MLIIDYNEEAKSYLARLPSAYKEVEYIENNGTAYFKLGINIRDGYKFVGKIRSLQNENIDGGALTGGYI